MDNNSSDINYYIRNHRVNPQHILDYSLLNAAMKGNLPEVQALITLHANVNAVDDNGMTPLMHALSHGSTNIVTTLMQHGADVNVMNKKHNMTSLMYALNSHNITLIKILFDKGVSIHVAKSDGLTPLMCAAKSDFVDAINFFIENGADINAVDKKGMTALMHASEHRFLKAVQTLIQHGANIYATDNNGSTALTHAHNNYQEDAIKSSPCMLDFDIVNLFLNKMPPQERDDYASINAINKIVVDKFKKDVLNEEPSAPIVINWFAPLGSNTPPAVPVMLPQQTASSESNVKKAEEPLEPSTTNELKVEQKIKEDDTDITFEQDAEPKLKSSQDIDATLAQDPEPKHVFDPSVLKEQDTDVTFVQDPEPKPKSSTDMIYECFSTLTNGFFSLFNQGTKRERDENEKQKQSELNNPNKKRRLD